MAETRGREGPPGKTPPYSSHPQAEADLRLVRVLLLVQRKRLSQMRERAYHRHANHDNSERSATTPGGTLADAAVLARGPGGPRRAASGADAGEGPALALQRRRRCGGNSDGVLTGLLRSRLLLAW